MPKRDPDGDADESCPLAPSRPKQDSRVDPEWSAARFGNSRTRSAHLSYIARPTTQIGVRSTRKGKDVYEQPKCEKPQQAHVGNHPRDAVPAARRVVLP